ncbi:chromosomal replication initiator protein DnaA [Candidatus Azambacteria bacterium]|nr:chromosomal replication initiator protein DnaA [Candidatus Azambacteria bacterium]MBI2587869.1 chromosomal replication initiator protein DnaA [Candidatus Azambacteria bacterium]
MTHDELWQAALGEIELQLSRANFLTWFRNTSVADRREGMVIVSVPNAFTKEWLENKYNKYVLRALRNLLGDIREVQYVIGEVIPERRREVVPRFREEPVELAPPEEQLEFPELAVDPETNLNPRYTFAAFIVGSSNELAHAAAQAVVDHLGSRYNPLFIYGGVGLGKTHLLQAIGNAVIERFGRKKRAKYVTTEKFTNELIHAIRNQTVDEFRNKYRDVDTLLLDDIQFITGKEKTQEEIFHTFNTLYGAGKQIVLSSDRPPAAIATLEERLRSRFEGGMIADIGFPDFEMRVAILKAKAQERGLSLTDEILQYLAEKIQKNIRELEGALTRIAAATRLLPGGVITKAEVDHGLAALSAQPNRLATPKQIVKTVADFYDIELKELTERCRKKEIVRPRQIAMYLLREELKSSYPFIGEKLGHRDHTTAIHACEKIGNELTKDPRLQEEITLIRKRIYSA